MPKKVDEEDKKIRCEIIKNWGITDNILRNFVRTRIEIYKKKDKRETNFDDEEMEERFIEMVCDIGVGFEVYQGKFCLDYFFKILHNWTNMAIDEETKRRKNNGGM